MSRLIFGQTYLDADILKRFGCTLVNIYALEDIYRDEEWPRCLICMAFAGLGGFDVRKKNMVCYHRRCDFVQRCCFLLCCVGNVIA